MPPLWTLNDVRVRGTTRPRLVCDALPIQSGITAVLGESGSGNGGGGGQPRAFRRDGRRRIALDGGAGPVDRGASGTGGRRHQGDTHGGGNGHGLPGAGSRYSSSTSPAPRVRPASSATCTTP